MPQICSGWSPILRIVTVWTLLLPIVVQILPYLLFVNLMWKKNSEDTGIMFSEASASSTANSCWHLHAIETINSAVVVVIININNFHNNNN